ncbi:MULTISPECIES: MFS transporter [Pontibacillus]|uniref:MFS transporter n=1 Tax=Pontibacillus chungwhensis TaxID=265426 RepID=A0ABY8UTW3_9BACI|nr:MULTISPECIES: MFS transporter [Pontibacillus]MCD5323389.1 MFS transporter [Pontibacillus sp. HN14]WIF96770.1 MFS transporter [Pontibacillus chungwhensis]
MSAKPNPVPPVTIAEEPSILKQPKAVWAVFFACIIAFMGLGLVDPILPAIAKQLDAAPSEVTLLFTSYNAVMAVAMLVTGVITSRIGMKYTLLSGIVIIALFSGLGGLSNGIWELVFLRGGWGLGNALFVATALTAIVTLSNSGNAKAIILYEAAIGLGISVGPLIGGWLGAMSWRGPFLGVATLMVIAFIGLTTLMPRTQSAGGTKRKKTSLADPFRALQHRSLLVLGIAAALYNYGFFTLLAFSPFVLGLDEHGLGMVFLGWGILLAITSVFMAPKLQKWIGTVKSMCLMLTLFAATLLAMGIWTSAQWVVIAAVIFAGALLGNNNTLITTAVMNASPVERSTASAAYSFLRFLGGALAPFLAGKLAEIFNSSMPFYVGAFFVLLSVVFVWMNKKHIMHVDEAEAH